MRSPLIPPSPLFPLTVGLLALVACSENSLEMSDSRDASDTGMVSPENEDGAGGSDGGGDGGDDWDAEEEDDFLALQPATTNAYVFVTNPTRNTVTRIAVPSLAVITTDVGSDPSVVATTQDYTKAIVFNQGSDDITIIDAESLEKITVEVRANFNQMRVSPDGVWAICYHDADAESESSGGGVQSYSEVSVVNTDTGEHFPMVVGFNPREVQFTDDSSLAVVVSDAYLALIDLTDAEPSPDRIPISEDLIDPPEAEEVLLAPDGTYAFVRQFGATDLTLVDLFTQTVDSIATGDNPTDLDITPDGTQAIAVARGSSELWIYELADPYGTAAIVDMPESDVFGSVLMSPDNSKGLLYSTATGLSRYGVWDRSTDEVTAMPLEKPVDAIGISPTGGTALIFHDKTNGSDTSTESPFYNSHALTLVDLGDFFPTTLKLPAEPTAFAHTHDGETGFYIMDGSPYLVGLDYSTHIYDEVKLKSDPVHLGVLPDTRTVFVSQEHDLGRISFYDADAEELTTITGFELNAGIEY